MTLRTVPVTCTAIDQNGNPVAGGRFRFVLTGTDIDQGLVAPESVDEQADENGVLVINLWPNQLGVNGTSYRVRCWNPDTGRKYLDEICVVPNAPCRLEQIIQMEPYPAVDAAQQALTAVQAAQFAVNAKVVEAEASKVAAASSAASASVSAQTATTKASEASTSAASVAASAVTAATKASESQASATAAANSANAAATSATNAAASAANAATSATTATTKASEASGSATSASASAATATTQATTATTQAGIATAKASEASTSASGAAGSASTATTKASEAAASAASAAASATSALGGSFANFQSTGMPNGIAYLNVSKVLTTGSGLTFDGTNFGVGGSATGITTSFSGLQVHNPNASQGAQIRLTNFGTGATSADGIGLSVDATGLGYLWNYESAGLSFGVASSEQMRLTSTGLGVGTSSPAYKLQVGQAFSGSKLFVAGSYGPSGVYIGPNTGNSGAQIELASHASATQAVSWKIGQDTDAAGFGPLVFQYAGPSSTYSGFSYAEKMRLDPSGNLGIGTSSPSRKLTVASETSGLPTLGTGSGGLFLSSNNGLYGLYGGVNGLTGDSWLQAMRNDSATAYNLVLQPSGGNVGLGVAPSAWQSSYTALQLRGGGLSMMSASGSGFVFGNSYYDSSFRYYANGAATLYANGGGIHAWHTAPSGTAGAAISFTQAMTLDASGNLVTGGTVCDTGRNITVTGAGVTASTAPYFTVNSRGLAGTNGTVFTAGGLLFAGYRDIDNPAYHAGITWNAVNANGVTSYPEALIFRLGTLDGFSGGRSFSYSGNAALPTERMRLDASGNLLIGTTSAVEKLTHNGRMFLANQTAPATPSGGGVIYVEGGALKYKGSSGTVTTLAPA